MAGLWPDVSNQNAPRPPETRPAGGNFPAHVLWNVLHAQSPDDPMRLALGVVFMGECFDFIVRHEFAHLALGHLNPDDRRALKGDLLALQALELAADGHAAILGLEPLRDMPRKLGRSASAIDDAHKVFHRTPEDAMTNYLLAIFLVFRLMDEANWDTRTLPRRVHPPAPIRFHATCIHLIEYCHQNGDAEGAAQVQRTMQDIWEVGETMFAATIGRPPNHGIKQLVLSEDSERHYNRISDRAKGLPRHLLGLSDDPEARSAAVS